MICHNNDVSRTRKRCVFVVFCYSDTDLAKIKKHVRDVKFVFLNLTENILTKHVTYYKITVLVLTAKSPGLLPVEDTGKFKSFYCEK